MSLRNSCVEPSVMVFEGDEVTAGEALMNGISALKRRLQGAPESFQMNPEACSQLDTKCDGGLTLDFQISDWEKLVSVV